MTKPRSLTVQVRQQLLLLGIALFISCVAFIVHYSWNVSHLTSSILMELEGQAVLRDASKDPGFELPRRRILSAYWQWQHIPERQRQPFTASPVQQNVLYEAEIMNTAGEKNFLYLMDYKGESGHVYLLAEYTEQDIQDFTQAFYLRSILPALLATSMILLSLFFLVRWIIRRTSIPLLQLSQWAKQLGEKPEQSNEPNFSVIELNQIAHQLQQGIQQLQAYNLREQQFLKHASHELRTPQAIIQASLDTLALTVDDRSQPFVNRALKASDNMRNLTSALLWLARNPELPVVRMEVELDHIVWQLIEQYRHLISQRKVELQTEIPTTLVSIEVEYIKIVFANLIRNAFNHSGDGRIHIKLSRQQLTITNPAEDSIADKVHCFGLGLQLVERICDKLQWQFEYQPQGTQICVTVYWAM